MASGDLLLEALTHWGQTSQDRLRAAMDAIGFPADLSPAQAAGDVTALGHAEPANGGLFVNPAQVYRTNCGGTPTACLAGARTPRQLERLRAEATAKQLTLETKPNGEFAPATITLAGDATAIADASQAAGFEHIAQPPALAICYATPSIASFLETLPWRREPELEWPRTDYDHVTLRFTPPRCETEDLRLSRLRHPYGYHVYVLRRDGENAIVHLDWGRAASLAVNGRALARHDPKTQTICTPHGARLPPPLRRAATMSTGRLPAISPEGETYGGLPPALASHILQKLR